jgi:hypothetical protein
MVEPMGEAPMTPPSLARISHRVSDIGFLSISSENPIRLTINFTSKYHAHIMIFEKIGDAPT